MISSEFPNPDRHLPRITPEERPLRKGSIMKRTIVRHGSIAAVALTLSLGLAACGGDSEGDTASSDDSTSQTTTEVVPLRVGVHRDRRRCGHLR